EVVSELRTSLSETERQSAWATKQVQAPYDTSADLVRDRHTAKVRRPPITEVDAGRALEWIRRAGHQISHLPYPAPSPLVDLERRPREPLLQVMLNHDMTLRGTAAKPSTSLPPYNSSYSSESRS